MNTLQLIDTTARVDLSAFAARVVRLDPSAVVRLRATGDRRVQAWAQTPYGVLATRSVPGSLVPVSVTVAGSELLVALAVERDDRIVISVTADVRWRAELPPRSRWELLLAIPAEELDRFAEQGLALLGEHAGPHGPSEGLLDKVVVAAGHGRRPVRVPMRCLFALASVGLLGDAGRAGTPGESGASDTTSETGGPVIRLLATESWLRLDARFGSVVCQRRVSLPLVSV